MIDRLVDGAKAQKNQLNEGIYKAFGTTKEKKTQENRRAQELKRADEYDVMQSKEAEVRKMMKDEDRKMGKREERAGKRERRG